MGSIPTGRSTLTDPPPYYRRVWIWVRGMGWRRGYFAEYSGRPRAVISGVPGRWYAKFWLP